MGYTLHKARSTPLALFLCMATLTACNTLPTVPTEGAWLSVNGPDTPTGLPSSLNSFLSEAPSGSSISLADSPWGGDVLIHADAAYFAASGRTCRSLSVHGDHGQRQALVCRKSEDGWEKVRVLTHMGQARPASPSPSTQPGPVGEVAP
ncbi:DVU3141 family protein [Ectothiorhodospira lacustris]|uniref:DVU3141 family protein n=1 Tax=Ectothiorhodospira lacustris TaxID=2899127 RepID=UPI001EE7B7FD|nr:DVU3141 family protein [Ectothiorhodospira lacustris]MCG5499542.1 hypothetical protein [Ectothiorhodospira lacustris]